MTRIDAQLVTGEYYHVFNRGVAKQEIFKRSGHFYRFERTLNYYTQIEPAVRLSRFLNISANRQLLSSVTYENSTERLVEIVAYCLMPNHYHLLLKQLADGGVSKFIGNVANSYTRYFNTVTNRVGPLFQGPFKAVLVSCDSYLLQLSRYIHINPLAANLVTKQELLNYQYSSLSQYLGTKAAIRLPVNPKIVMDMFNSRSKSYLKFCLNINDYGDSLPSFADLLLDIND